MWTAVWMPITRFTPAIDAKWFWHRPCKSQLPPSQKLMTLLIWLLLTSLLPQNVWHIGISMSLCIELQDHVSSSSAYVSWSNISSAVWDSNDTNMLLVSFTLPKNVWNLHYFWIGISVNLCIELHATVYASGISIYESLYWITRSCIIFLSLCQSK